MKIKIFFSLIFIVIAILLLSRPDTKEGQPSLKNTNEGDITDFVNSLPIVDHHAHLWPTTKTENDAYIDSLVATAKKAGVAKIMLGLHARHLPQRPPIYSAEHDTWTMEAHDKYPDMIVPMINGFDPNNDNSITYVENLLQTKKWAGIGELDLRNKPKQTETPANTANMMEIYKLAAKYNVPVIFHYDDCYKTECRNGRSELLDAFSKNPNTTFIFGHACPADLMAKFNNLYCEYEWPNGNIPKQLTDRVLLGTDIQSPDLAVHNDGKEIGTSYEESIKILRSRLVPLGKEAAENIAYKTSEKIFHYTLNK
ncbi:MAG: TatD family hydrolase [Candidatus Paceibacterota bacterium]